MRTIEIVLLASLCTLLLPRQEQQEEEKPRKKSDSAVTRFFQEQSERLDKEAQGSWMLLDYADPLEAPLDGSAGGFASFQDGFLTLILAIDTVESRLFRARERLLLRTGAYRYRFDEQGALQLSSVMSFTSQTEDGELEREPSGQAFEYLASITDGLLELRNSDGVQLSFRKVTAGEFPQSAIRKLDARRGGVDHWEEEQEEDEEPPR